MCKNYHSVGVGGGISIIEAVDGNWSEMSGDKSEIDAFVKITNVSLVLLWKLFVNHSAVLYFSRKNLSKIF